MAGGMQLSSLRRVGACWSNSSASRPSSDRGLKISLCGARKTSRISNSFAGSGVVHARDRAGKVGTSLEQASRPEKTFRTRFPCWAGKTVRHFHYALAGSKKFDWPRRDGQVRCHGLSALSYLENEAQLED